MLSHAKGILANILWGLVVAYYFFVRSIDVDRMLIYRILFTFLTLSILNLWQRKSFSRKRLASSVIPAILITINGYVYLLAIATGHAMEAAFAYFITPILTLLSIRIFLGGKYTLQQWVGTVFCIISVVYYGVATKILPWYGFGIALPFALYITWHRYAKTASSLEALRYEYSLLAAIPPVYFFLTWGESSAAVSFELTGSLSFLIALSGLVTLIPLALFVGASTALKPIFIGLYQFIGPIISMTVAMVLFGENLTIEKLILAGGLFAGMALAVIPFSRPAPHAGGSVDR